MLSVLAFCVSFMVGSSYLMEFDGLDFKPIKLIEASPLFIECTLSDVVVITVPLVENARYYLHKPNGDAAKIHIKKSMYNASNELATYEYKLTKHAMDYKNMFPVDDFKVIISNLSEQSQTDKFVNRTGNFAANDIVIGPLMPDDHGNWAFSAYYQDMNGDWIETSKDITISIQVFIPANHPLPAFNLGETFEFCFAYPIVNVETCEVIPPKSTFDRLYERNQTIMDSCCFIIKNLTMADHGEWTIIGVGRVVYITRTYLEIRDDMNSSSNVIFTIQE